MAIFWHDRKHLFSRKCNRNPIIGKNLKHMYRECRKQVWNKRSIFSEILSTGSFFLRSTVYRKHICFSSVHVILLIVPQIFYLEHCSENGLPRENNPAECSASKHIREIPFSCILSLINISVPCKIQIIKLFPWHFSCI